MLQCNTCKEFKSKKFFYKNKGRKRGYDYKCKKCREEYTKNLYLETPEKYKRYKERRRIIAFRSYAKIKGLLSEEAVRLINETKYCQICGKGGKLVIDHDHNTKKVRGVLCAGCNLMLGLCHDRIDILKNATKYLKC